MMNIYRCFAILLGGLFLSSTVLGNDHAAGSRNGTMAHANLCYLKEGKSMSDVDSLNKEFFAFLKDRDLAPLSVILTPVATSTRTSQPPYDFIEMMFAEHSRIGQMWDAILESERGQKILAGWSAMTDCVTSFSSLLHKFQDADGQARTDSRVVEFNRCESHPAAWGQLGQKHDEMLANRGADATNIYWGLLLPETGSSGGWFRHLIAYPNMTAYTEAVAARNNAEYRGRMRDYNQNWAQCDGLSVWAGRVQNRP